MRLVTSTEEIQEILLPILIYIDKLCKEHNLRYSLAGGTLLGAVRHKGFIPWDDDIDIMMPRPDYDRLIMIVQQGFSSDYGILSTYDLDNFYVGKVSKLYSKHTLLKEFTDELNLEYGAFVDIIPIEGVPNDYETRLKMSRQIHYYSRALHLYVASLYSKNIVRKRCSCLFKNLAQYALKKSNEIFYKYPFEKSEYVTSVIDQNFEKVLMRREYFDDLCDVDFMGHKVKIFTNYERYLKTMYGNYMEFPPPSKRYSQHSFELYQI